MPLQLDCHRGGLGVLPKSQLWRFESETRLALEWNSACDAVVHKWLLEGEHRPWLGNIAVAVVSIIAVAVAVNIDVEIINSVNDKRKHGKRREAMSVSRNLRETCCLPFESTHSKQDDLSIDVVVHDRDIAFLVVLVDDREAPDVFILNDLHLIIELCS